jgi:hypothetical protein
LGCPDTARVSPDRHVRETLRVSLKRRTKKSSRSVLLHSWRARMAAGDGLARMLVGMEIRTFRDEDGTSSDAYSSNEEYEDAGIDDGGTPLTNRPPSAGLPSSASLLERYALGCLPTPVCCRPPFTQPRRMWSGARAEGVHRQSRQACAEQRSLQMPRAGSRSSRATPTGASSGTRPPCRWRRGMSRAG